MKTINRNRVAIFVAALILLLVTIVLLFRWAGGDATRRGETMTELEPDTVRLSTLFVDEEMHARLDRELEIFRERYPQIEIEHDAVPYRTVSRNLMDGESPADLITILNPATFGSDGFHASPVPWSGEIWTLYYNRRVLDRVLGQPPTQPQNFGELIELFERVDAGGLRPLALGASHGWPLTSLVQHVAGGLAGNRGTVAQDIAAGRVDPDGPELQRVFALLREWRERSWIPADAPHQPWTAGVRQVLEGEAAFTLLNQQFFTPVPYARRDEIAFLVFPGEWAIGSVIYLARPSGRPDRPAVVALESFLTSPGTVDRLERTLGRPFFGGVQDAALPAVLIPSITGDPNAPYHRRLWQAAVDAVW